jgi:hypothetical protein
MKTEELIEILKQHPGADVYVWTQANYAAYLTEIREDYIEYDEETNSVIITGCH